MKRARGTRRIVRRVTAALAVVALAPSASTAGDGAIQITFDPGEDWSPAWSPDGSQIAYHRGGIWVVPSTGGTPTLITSPGAIPDWSPDGSQIIYNVLNNQFDIWLVPATGGTGTQLTFTESSEIMPDWSPDGSQIAFVLASSPGGNYDIYSCPVDSPGLLTQLTSGPELDSHPAWSPDGNQIAFMSDRGGDFDIWVIPASGGTATQLTFDGGGAPTWSPDGSQIAFVSDRSGNADIWAMPVNGGAATQVTFDPAQDTLPAWSPDGSRIAFRSDRSGNYDIWVISLPPVSIEQKSWGSVKDKYR